MSQAEEMVRLARERAGELAARGLDSKPRRKLAVLTCMDTRLDVFPMLGIERGDAHIIRNAGGLVSDDALRSLAVSQRVLGTEEIIVVMHDGCGLLGASDQEFADALAADGARPAWRLGAFDDVDRALGRSLALLRQAPALIHRDSISGFVFTPDTGALREVDALDEVGA